MTRSGVIACLLCVCAAAAAFARPGTVTTRDGHTYEGDIDDRNADFVIVNVKGIETRIDRSRIASVESSEGFDKEFKEKLAKLGPKDAVGRIALAREAFDERKYILARDALEQTLTIDPNNADAVALLETVRGQIRLEAGKQHPPDENARAGAEAGAGATGPATQPAEPRLLKKSDVNTIRQWELRQADTGVRLRFDRDVRKRYAMMKGIPLTDFMALNATQQAWEILEHGPVEMRQDVIVLSDPPAIFQYRRMVQPYVLQNCATAACHGKPGAPGFSLVNPADSELATYTNFFILQQYTKKVPDSGGPFARGELKLIDRVRPEDSLLLQYSLPTQISQYRHSPVQGFRPPLRGTDDPRYRQLYEWTHDWLKSVEPNYGIDFKQPSSTQPTSTPATGPAASAPGSAPARVRGGAAAP
jgi:hypothetical protein